MKPRVYVENSIISVLAARPARDVVLAGRQLTTHNWWEMDARSYELYASELVQLEAAQGDPEIVRVRLEILGNLPILPVGPEVAALAEQFLAAGIIPAKAATDALHVAAASIHGMHYLLTWNCKHLANVFIRDRISRYLASFGYNVPVICTPLELPGDAR